jgi:steroid delta-isomerase-like uncharacterized protein
MDLEGGNTMENGRYLALVAAIVLMAGSTLLTAKTPAELIAIRDAADRALNAHDLDTFLSYAVDDFVFDLVPLPQPLDTEGTRMFFGESFASSPDWHTTEGPVFATDNIVLVEHMAAGTNTGAPWQGIPAAGNSWQLPHLDIYEFEGDKIKQITTYADMASLMIQLGAMPAPEMPDLVPSVTLPDGEPTGLSPLEANSEAFSRWNSHDISLYAKMMRPDASFFVAALGMPMDRNAYAAVTELYHSAFSDVQGKAVRSVDMGDGWVLSDAVFSGTHDGPYFGIPATGNPMSVRTGVLHRFDENGLITNLNVYYDNLTVVSQITVEEWPLEGVWVTSAPTPLGNMIIRCTYVAQDSGKTRFSGELDQINWYPLLTDIYPDSETVKFAGGQAVKIGVNKYEGTFLEYFTKTTGLSHEEIVGIGIITGTFEFVGPDQIQGQGTGAYYMAQQDADQDGFPDEGQEPVICLPWQWTAKRLTTMPGCVPTPLP